MKIMCSTVLMVMYLSAIICAQENPFFTQENRNHQEQVQTTESVEEQSGKETSPLRPNIFHTIIRYNSNIQRTLKDRLTTLSEQLDTGNFYLGALLLLLVAFLYGVFHAIGPGHGKVFTLSYVCSEGSSLRKGVLLGILIAYMHAFSAVIVVMGIYYLFISLPLFKTSDTITYFIQTVSYGVIALLGLFLLVKKIVMVIKKMPDHGTTTSTASYWTLLFSLGMVPCPGTVIILLFAISIHKIALGLGMSFAMATGMALTLSCLGLSAALLKKGLSVTGRKIAFWVHGVEIFGSLLLFLIGLFLFFSYL